MAKKPTHTRRKAAAKPRAAAKPMPPPPQDRLLPGLLTDQQRDALADPLHGVDPLERLEEAMRAVGIDPTKARQPDWMDDAWPGIVRIEGEHSELVALAVEHAKDARALAAARPRTEQEGRRLDKQVGDLVLATLYRRHNTKLPAGVVDTRKPVWADGSVVALVPADQDARSRLLTVKIPAPVIDRLRAAVKALAPHRTMAGIVTLGITLVLDMLEAEHIKREGRRFPDLAGEVLTGGRPRRTTVTTAESAPPGPKSRKAARRGHKHP